MYTIISPSKTQDFSRNFSKGQDLAQISQYNRQTKQLAKIMKGCSTKDLEALMHVSEKIGALNHERFQKWDGAYKERKKDCDGNYNFSPALYAFMGDVYRGFELDHYEKKDFAYAKDHLGIISGFYGLLSPLTYIQPYRLEMGTKIPFVVGKVEYKNLYAFWQEVLTADMNKILKKENFLVNLASVEYAKVIDRKNLGGEVIDVNFKIAKNGEVRTIAIYAKRARGLMANWIIQKRIDNVNDLKEFNCDDWMYDTKGSKAGELLFVKEIS